MLFSAKLSHFFHPVHDIKEALKFFRDVLGLKLIYSNLTETTEEMVNDGDVSKINWLEFDAGYVTMIVQQVPGIKPYETGIGFWVPSCDEAYVYLKNNDVNIISAIQGIAGKQRTFEIKDPTGSTFNIFGH